MNFPALLQAAKMLFPNNSKLFEAAEKAAEFCKKYDESEAGFNQIVKDLNLSPEFLANHRLQQRRLQWLGLQRLQRLTFNP